MTVAISAAFRKMTIRAVLAIVLFIFTYLLLFALAAGLTLASGFAGFIVISAIGLNYISAAIGLGLISVGVLILYFLIKFLFKQHKVDRSHLTELTREEQPELFAFIEEIVQQVGTTFPKKIYLASDVNAAVFYDSSFWSMFFPVRKNLLIGIGLINTVSRLELKAILAHEFGHFSQRSMKLGSYVYNVNQVIYNMLHDNESFNRVLQNWYLNYADADQSYDERIGYYNALGQSIEFMRVTTPFEQIERNLVAVAAAEKELKVQIRMMQETALFRDDHTGDNSHL
ncbi:M48 family metallopeptidase [Chitinophaga pendula]|uniref:M48 family metallopeptidase n=1 Tax=Chitinophaga TaxID=79328 RepID=UPI000BAFBD82|nr:MULTISPECIES: M48 family metallopeptidase [Chitinophaga]ASZ13879.1 hypothetical protein CK934_24440 [Chitinophaga sp. MD30]UCJ08501.1 M48 family metallopeptidase [Chitinophaga pendula]